MCASQSLFDFKVSYRDIGQIELQFTYNVL